MYIFQFQQLSTDLEEIKIALQKSKNGILEVSSSTLYFNFSFAISTAR